MTIELTLTNLIFILMALIGAFWAMVKVIVSQYERSLDSRFKTLSATIDKGQEIAMQLERDFLKFQSEIPRVYLRREDYQRESQALQGALQREIEPIRVSVNRIEDFLIQK